MDTRNVGMIGLGLMGSALTERLLQAGYTVWVHNRTREKAEPLVARGARWAENPLSDCDRVLISLYTTDTVEEMLDRLSDGLRPGQILIDTTTGEPEQTARLGARLAARGVQYLDAPISGSSQQTRRGEVTTADVYELRFNRSVAVLFALVGIANMSVKIGLMLKGTGALIESATGTYVDTELAILAVTVMVVAGGVVFALWVPTVVKALEIWFMMAAMMGLVFWIGLLWRRLTVVGAWVTTLSGFATWWITTQSWFIDWVARLPVADAWRLLWVENDKTSLYLPWQILLYMTVAVVAGVVVSLFTRQVPQDKLDRFYTLSRTPVAPGEQLVEPCVLPPSTVPAKRTMLITGAGLEIPLPSKASLIGFVVVWICVALMIGGFVGMVSWS
jgi:hypothetical protein